MGIIQVFLTVARIGLVMNIIGTLMIALSFGKNLEDAHQMDRKRRKVYLASFLHPKVFKFELVIIIFGFLLQLIGS